VILTVQQAKSVQILHRNSSMLCYDSVQLFGCWPYSSNRSDSSGFLPELESDWFRVRHCQDCLLLQLHRTVSGSWELILDANYHQVRTTSCICDCLLFIYHYGNMVCGWWGLRQFLGRQDIHGNCCWRWRVLGTHNNCRYLLLARTWCYYCVRIPRKRVC
jgi:hypothetical protein